MKLSEAGRPHGSSDRSRVPTLGQIWQMIDEMLIAEAEWLPQYTQAIAEAKERFAKGDLIPTKVGYQGAVRIREKTVEEISAERESRTITAE